MGKYEKWDLVKFKWYRLGTPNIMTRWRVLKYIEEEVKPFFWKTYIKKYYLIENLDAYHCWDDWVPWSIVKIEVNDVYYKLK